MYLSESRRVLRANHLDHELSDVRTTPPRRGYRGARYEVNRQGYDDDRVVYERRQIMLYMHDYPALTWQLAGVPRSVCGYNPFRDYEEGNYGRILVPDEWCAPNCHRA